MKNKNDELSDEGETVDDETRSKMRETLFFGFAKSLLGEEPTDEQRCRVSKCSNRDSTGVRTAELKISVHLIL